MPSPTVFWPPAHKSEKRILRAVWRRHTQLVQENTGLHPWLCFVLPINAHKTLDVSIKMPMPASRTVRGRMLLNFLLKIQIIRDVPLSLG
jgi:hypothetical protein